MCPKNATYNTIFCPIFEIYSLTTIFVWFKMIVVPIKGQEKKKGVAYGFNQTTKPKTQKVHD